MIKVDYLNDSNLRNWYWEKVSVKIKNKIAKSSEEFYGDSWLLRLKDLSILNDIIFLPLDLLSKKYVWISDYMQKCRVQKKSDTVIAKCMNPSILRPIKHELMEKMRVNVCPYCNQQYVYIVYFSKSKKVYLGDIDHILPKSIYSLFALSLWNLVPACKSCNQTFKGAISGNFLSPVMAGFDEDCIFHINYDSVNAIQGVSDDFTFFWKLMPKKDNGEKLEKIKRNLELFRLNEIYSVHKEEIKIVLKKRARFCSNAYRKSIDGMFSDKNEALNSFFGEYLDETSYTLYPHSKMIHDILLYN